MNGFRDCSYVCEKWNVIHGVMSNVFIDTKIMVFIDLKNMYILPQFSVLSNVKINSAGLLITKLPLEIIIFFYYSTH